MSLRLLRPLRFGRGGWQRHLPSRGRGAVGRGPCRGRAGLAAGAAARVVPGNPRPATQAPISHGRTTPHGSSWSSRSATCRRRPRHRRPKRPTRTGRPVRRSSPSGRRTPCLLPEARRPSGLKRPRRNGRWGVDPNPSRHRRPRRPPKTGPRFPRRPMRRRRRGRPPPLSRRAASSARPCATCRSTCSASRSTTRKAA